MLCEVEAIINFRPISKACNDPLDLEPLTPNHLLLLKGKATLPPGLFSLEDCYAKRRWRQVQYMADLFWKRWTREYLPELQERQKWTKKRRNFVAGDIVLIIDDTAPRNSWVMGRITQTLPDKRGFVRQVQVLTKTSTLTRPITKLALLLEAPERRSLSLSLSPSIFIFISLYLSLSPILIYICVHYIQHGLRELSFLCFLEEDF